MSTASTTRHVLIGTAGHIDHGKTRLVARLTGIDTDRLPEEKSRGISIDLGFAHWTSDGFDFGVVDVPGHERFIRNMVAGATGINVGLLVVAADDGVMPQTREHLDIMDLLGIPTGVVAITKTDLIGADFVEIVASELHDLTAGTFLEQCRIVPVSSETGEGVDELRQTIVDAAGRIAWADPESLFRMPIDRVFTKPGYGTVVTGSVINGSVHAGDSVELLSDGRELRVRRVEVYGAEIDAGSARQRSAVNLASIGVQELHRGQEIASPGYLTPSTRLLVELHVLRKSRQHLKDRSDVDLHIGTSEVRGRLAMHGRLHADGGRQIAELRTKQPVVAAWGQRFILRRPSPAVTVAGGRILDPGIPRGRRLRDTLAAAQAMSASDATERLAALLAQSEHGCDAMQAAWRAGVRPEEFDECIRQLESRGDLMRLGDRRKVVVHQDRLEALMRSVMRTIGEEVQRLQPRRSLSRSAIRGICRGIADERVLSSVMNELVRQKQLLPLGPNLSPANVQVSLTKRQKQTLDTILEAVGDGGVAPPNQKELAAHTGQSRDEISVLLNLCGEDGLLTKITDDLYYTSVALNNARKICEQLLEASDGRTLAEIRDSLGITRKHAIPLCEFFDNRRITVRDGNLRTAGPEIRRTIE